MSEAGLMGAEIPHDGIHIVTDMYFTVADAEIGRSLRGRVGTL
jgi:hypothetical protein